MVSGDIRILESDREGFVTKVLDAPRPPDLLFQGFAGRSFTACFVTP